MTIASLLAPFLAMLLCAAADNASPPGASAFDDFSPQTEFPPSDVVRTLLRPVPGFAGEITESTRFDRPSARLAGLLRYEEVWPVGSALRVALIDIQSLQIHVWAGEQGVSLRFRPEAGRSGAQWAIYGASRRGQSPRPEQLALWATDEGRFRRTGEGTFELHWDAGYLAMSRGDVVLWRVPLTAAPKEVVFDGSAILRGLGTFRSAGLPPAEADLPLLRDVPRPAELDWQENLSPDATCTKHPDGTVQLSAAERSKASQVFAIPGPAGLHEFVFELDAEAGTGIYLGDESGEPLVRAGFFRARGRAGLMFGLAAGRSMETERTHADGTAIPYAGSRQWLRLMLAGGIARLWTSGDGRHWSRPPESTIRSPGGCRSIGLYCSADASARSIRLRRLEVRRLDALESLAPAELVQQVQIRTVRNSRGRSTNGPSSERPAGVAEEVWRRAIAIRGLIDCPNSSVGQSLLGPLLREAVQSSRPVEDALRLVAQGARITENGESGHGAMLASLYELLGRRLLVQRQKEPFARIRRAMLTEPLALPASVPFAPSSGQLLRYQLLLAAYEGRWDDLASQCRESQFWSRARTWSSQPLSAWEQTTGLVIDWATAQLEAHRRSRLATKEPVAAPPGKDNPTAAPVAPLVPRGRRPRSPRPATLADSTHPVIERLGKEAYNTAADLEAAVAGGSLREACQIIRTAADSSSGLVPDDDAQLGVSLELAVQRAFAAHPDLAATMQQAFGPLADLRLKQAIDAADPAAVELLVQQFPGTRAAGMGHQWLGDRALAAGQFPQALRHYRRVQNATTASEQAALDARLRLAGAILGQSLASPIPATAAVELGQTTLPGAEFEQLIAALLVGKAAARREPATATPRPTIPAASAGPIETRSWGQIPTGPEQRWWTWRRPLDLAARQTSIRFYDQRMLVCTPARVIAFNLSDGRVAWTQSFHVESDRVQPGAGWIEPVECGSRILLRRPPGRPGQLASLSLSDGSIVWSTPADVAVVSDPVAAGPCVLALLASPTQAGQVAIQLGQFDSATGRLLTRWPVVELRDVWQGAPSGRLAATDDCLVATIGGAVVACDWAGRVRWVRRQTFVPPQVDAYPQSRATRNHEAPCIVQGRIYATQPGVWAVECLDLATGRLLWRRAEPDLVSLVDADARRVILATGVGLTGLDATSGRQLWTREDLDPLEVAPVADGSTVLRATVERPNTAPPELWLEWIDAATGQVRSRAPLALSLERRTAFGPLAAGNGRLWVILSRTDDPQRHVVLLGQ